MGKMQRQKGKAGEREIVNLSRKVGLMAVRTWQTAQSGVNPECDVLVAGRPYQVKRRRAFKFLYEAMEGVNGVFLRGDGQAWLAVVPAEEFLALLKRNGGVDEFTTE